MADLTTTETPTTPTEGTTSSEAAATTLLTSTEAVATPEQQQADPAAAAAAAADKPAEEAKPAAETPKPEGAPEKYEFKAPDGKEYDAAVLEPFSAAAKEAGLTQAAAQTILEKMAPALAARQSEQVTAVQTGWVNDSKSDKEFGGDSLPANLAIAKTALDTFATPEFRKLLDDTGLGNHPEVIRTLVRVGKGLKEDSFVGGGATKGPTDIAAKLYPNSPTKG